MAGYNETLQAYLRAMSRNPNKVNQVSNASLDSLSDEDNSALKTSAVIKQGERALQGETHQDDKTFIQRAKDTARSVGVNLYKGILGFFDEIGDMAMGITGSIASWAGNTELEKNMKDAINYDWQSQGAQILYSINNPLSFAWDAVTGSDSDAVVNAYKSGDEARDSFKAITTGNYNSKIEETVNSIETGIGKMIPSLALYAIPGMGQASTAAKVGIQAALGGVRGIGQGYETVAEKNGDMGKGAGYALVKGLWEAGTSAASTALGGGLSDKAKNILGSKVGLSVFGKTGSEALANFLGNVTSITTNAVMSAASNALESAIDPAVQMIFDSDAWDEAYGTEEARKQTFTNIAKGAIVGALTNAIVSGAKAIASPDMYATDYVGEKRMEIISKSPELMEASEKLNEAQEVLEASKDKVSELSEDLKSAADEDQKTIIMNQIKLERKTMEAAAVEVGKQADAIIPEINRQMITNEKAMTASTATHDAVKTAVESYKDGQAHDVGGLTAKADGNGNLTYSADTTGQAIDSIQAISGSNADTVDVSGAVLGDSEYANEYTFSADTDAQQLDLVKTCLADNSLQGAKYTHGDEVVFDYTNGTKLYFKGNKFMGVLSEAPKWMTGENISKSAVNAPEAMKKDSAVNGYIKYKYAKDVVEFTNDILADNSITYKSGTGFSISEQAKKLDTSWDMAKTDEDKKVAVHAYIESMFGKDASASGIKFSNADEFFDAVQMNREEFEDLLYQNMKSNEEPSTKDKAQEKIDKLNARNAQTIENARRRSIALRGKIGQLKNTLNVLNRFHALCRQAKNRYKDASTPTSAGNPFENAPVTNFDAQLLGNMDYKVSGRISADKVYAALFGAKSAYKVKIAREDAKYKEQHDALVTELGAYETDTEDYKLTNAKYLKLEAQREKTLSNRIKMGNGVHLIDFGFPKPEDDDADGQDLSMRIDELKQHFDADGNYHDAKGVVKHDLTIDDIESLSGIIHDVLDRNSQAYKDRIKEEKSATVSCLEEAKAVLRTNRKLGITSAIRGNVYNIKDIFGANSKAYKVYVKDIQKARQQSAKTKFMFQRELENAETEYGIRDKTYRAKVTAPLKEYGTNATKDVSFSKGQAMEIYAHSLSSENLEKMKTDGFMVGNGRFVYDDQTEAMVNSALTEQERDFVFKVFKDGYNGVIKNSLSKYSIDKHGYDYFQSNGDYMNRSMANLKFNPGEATSSLESSLGANKLKTRTNNTNPIDISDFRTHYATYCGTAADYIEMDAVRRADRLMNLHDATTGNSFVTLCGMIGAKQDKNGSVRPSSWFYEHMMRANNQTLVKDGKSNAFTWVYGNAASTPIMLNPATFVKMYLDPMRYAQEEGVGFGGVIKGYCKGLASIFAPGNQEVTINGRTYKNRKEAFRNESGVYRQSNAEDYAIKNTVMASNLSKVAEVASKPLEFANNTMMTDFAFQMCYDKIRNENPDVTDQSKLTSMAIDYFDSTAGLFLSNADSLDMSNLRNGQMGSVMKAVFGIFGGDNQKKTENFHEAIMGTRNSRLRLQGYTEQLQEIEDELNNMPAKTEKLKQQVQLGQITENEYNRQISAMKARSSDLETAKADLGADIKAEREYVAPDRIASRLGHYAGMLIATTAIETAIGYGASLAKGKRPGLKDAGEDFVYDLTVGWIPIVSTIGDAVRYNSKITPLQTEGLNQVVTAVSNIISLKDSHTDSDYRKTMYNTTKALGNVLGIPVSNLMDYIIGTTKNVNSEAGANLEVLFKGYNSSYLKKESQNYLKSGNLTRATRTTQANMAWFKTGSIDWETAKTITKLSAIPRDHPTDLSASQKDTFMKTYTQSNKSVSRLLSTSYYKNLKDDTARQKAIVSLYNAYYDASKQSVSEEDVLSTRLSKAVYGYYYNREALTKEQRLLLKKLGFTF